MSFYIAHFDSEFDPKYHTHCAIFNLRYLLSEKYDDEFSDESDELFDTSCSEDIDELVDKWDYDDYRRRLSKYNIKIDELAEKGFDVSKRHAGDDLMIIYYANNAKLKRIALKNMKKLENKYKDNPEKSKEVRQIIGKIKILENPQDLLDVMRHGDNMISGYEVEYENIAFNNFEDYLQYIFEHK